METTKEIESCTANLILVDIDSNKISDEIDETNENNSITMKIILDNIEEHIRVVKLETIPSRKNEMIGELFLIKNEKIVLCYSSTNIC